MRDPAPDSALLTDTFSLLRRVWHWSAVPMKGRLV